MVHFGNANEARAFFLFTSCEPPSAAVDVWAVCALYAYRAIECKLLCRLAVCIISHSWWKTRALTQGLGKQNGSVVVMVAIHPISIEFFGQR
jgi:hypothetical protein